MKKSREELRQKNHEKLKKTLAEFYEESKQKLTGTPEGIAENLQEVSREKLRDDIYDISFDELL